MLFGLFVTSLSTVYLGLSTCYHDAMWALVIQGACTGLVPVSKCSIGELANRQQRHHNAEIALTQQRQRLLRRQREQRRRQQSAEWKHELDEKTMSSVYKAESENGQSKAATANAHYDFASKGYSALVIALALGAARKLTFWIYNLSFPLSSYIRQPTLSYVRLLLFSNSGTVGWRRFNQEDDSGI